MNAKSNLKPTSRRLGPGALRLLERLCNACAVSGDEGEVRAIILEQVAPLAETVRTDALGNVLVEGSHAGNPGHAQGRRLRVMLAAHMDEVGFMLVQDEGDGLFRFDIVGGIDERQLVGKPVWVGRDHIPAVIGSKPIHLTTPEERQRAVPLDALRVDIGPGGDTRVKVGDRATFATPFARLGPSLRGKALDDRIGVATLIELLRDPPAGIDLLAAFTVQEEVGLRGAQVAAFAFEPDVAIALDCTPALDLPVWQDDGGLLDNARYNTRLDGGPAIYIADASTLADPRLVRLLVDTAESLAIPYQLRQPGGGGTDAGAIHLTRAGVPSISVSVPGRYLHTPASLARLSDWQNTLALLRAALERLTPDLLAGERA